MASLTQPQKIIFTPTIIRPTSSYTNLSIFFSYFIKFIFFQSPLYRAPKSISNVAQYVTLDSKIKRLSLAFFFGNPTNRTESGTVYIWGTTNSKPPGPIIVINQSEILSRSHVKFITLFRRWIYYTHFGRWTTVWRLLPTTGRCTGGRVEGVSHRATKIACTRNLNTSDSQSCVKIVHTIHKSWYIIDCRPNNGMETSFHAVGWKKQ